MRTFLQSTLCLAAVSLAICCNSSARAEDAPSYPDLVKRMIDLERLATLPAEGETCKQWSSYDRTSRYDEANDKYIGWDANGDNNGIIRTEGDKEVMAEMEGPGCIWRIWSAFADKGHVKIYLDGQEKPVVDLPFVDYFTGKTAPFDDPQLSYNLGNEGCSGQNLYFPIPYQKSCKIVADKGWGGYYHFNYVTYPKGTKLPTFKAELTAEDKAAVKKVGDFLREKEGQDPAGSRQGEDTISGAQTFAAKTTSESLRLEGPRAITAIRAKVRSNFKNREEEMAAMRRLMIEIRWDGQEKPAVLCPMGDFFGTAPGINYYKSLPLGITKEGAYCFWYMPFGKSAELRVINDDNKAWTLEYEITHAPLTKPMEQLGYFHCKWHRDTKPMRADRWPDWTMLETQGRGRFLGVNLHVWNPWGGWWGEGDEKFFVDGEKFPSTFGTGSEDYFGYAWCHPGLFQRANHGQTMTQGNVGHQSVHRWHITDNIPFQKSFEGAIEKYYGNDDLHTLYACTVRWYLAAGGTDPYGVVPAAERHGYYSRTPAKMSGIKIISIGNGNMQAQGMGDRKGGKWTNDDQLWWTGGQPGDRVELALTAPENDSYQVSLSLTKAPDYAIVQFLLDGKKVGTPVDLYDKDVILADPVDLGTLDLTAGEHILGVEIVGANEKAVKAYMFGIDEIRVKKADK